MKVIDESDLSFKRLDELHGQLLALEKEKVLSNTLCCCTLVIISTSSNISRLDVREKSDHLKQELDHLNTLNSLCAVLGMDFKQTIHEINPTLDDSTLDERALFIIVFDRLFEAISSYLLEATARIENPVRGCTALLVSFEQKVEELQARVTALEARLGGGSSCVNPLCSFAPSGSSSRFPSLAENNVPNVIPTVVNLSEPIFGGFLRLLMSKEGVQNILLTSTNLVENGAPLTEVDLPSFLNRSYDQATLDAVYQDASNSFLSQSSLDNFVADFAETTGLDWTASGNIHHDFFDSSSSDLSTVLNFDADDLQILQPFLND
ncbi:hypothetical protein LguiA_014899 [Lonicera macranthoides]